MIYTGEVVTFLIVACEFPSTIVHTKYIHINLSIDASCGRRGEDYERTLGGKTIAAGLNISVTPSEDLASAATVEISEELEGDFVKDEVSQPLQESHRIVALRTARLISRNSPENSLGRNHRIFVLLLTS